MIDAAIALNAAFFVNAAILILSAAVFHSHGIEVTTIEECINSCLRSSVSGTNLVRHRSFMPRPKLNPDRDAGRTDCDGGLSPPPVGPVASPPDYSPDRIGPGGHRYFIGR